MTSVAWKMPLECFCVTRLLEPQNNTIFSFLENCKTPETRTKQGSGQKPQQPPRQMSCEEHQAKCVVEIDGSLLWASFHLPWLNHMGVVIFLISCCFISPQEWARLDESHDFQAKQFDWGTDYYTQLLARNKKDQECSGSSSLWHCQYYCPAALWEVEIWEVHTAVYHQPGNLTSLDQRDILPQNQP